MLPVCGAPALALSSVTVDSALPSVKHCTVVVLLGLDAALVLQLSEFGSALLVHNLLELAAHSAVALTNLSKHICLMHLLHHRCLNHLFLVGFVLAVNFGLHVLALVLFHPFSLVVKLFLKFDILLTVSVNILKEVDTGLVFTIPLLFTGIPLLGIFLSNKLVDHFVVSFLILSNLLGVFLELDCFSAMFHTLFVFQTLEFLLAIESRVKQLQIALFLRELGLLTEKLFLLIVLNKCEISLPHEDMAFCLNLLLAFSLYNPLLFKHGALNDGLTLFCILDSFFIGLLPVKHSKGVSVKLCLFFSLSNFAL